MSDIQQAIRQFGDAIKEAEERHANHLGEVAAGVTSSGNSRRQRILTQLAKIEKATKAISDARAEIAIILDEDETADAHIVAEINTIRMVSMGVPQIEHKEKDDA